ncbi:TIM barrel protein [Flavobacterium aestuarii]|uniref:TIM barrel protein n=1 Tax=Flavobacterium aestuarii TaxID=3149227 RepID=UPI0032B436DB
MILNNIYISTLAFLGKTPEQIAAIAVENEFNIEFSSGMDYYENMEDFFLKAPIKNKLPHNYFPAPKIPFVLNLASSNSAIRNISINHCINGIKLAKAVNAPFFSAHAGFCIDPNPHELGKQINYTGNFNKEKHWELFFDSLNKILKIAEENEIDFLIENNVIAQFNLAGNVNPLLCCESSDIDFLFSKIKSDRLFLLLDTAHLKVSCVTLKLDLIQEFNKISSYIKGIHHSDNDGLADTNGVLDESYWFLQQMNKYENVIHVLEIKRLSVSEIKQNIEILKNA